MTEHNHLSTVVKPKGECPACDEVHARRQLLVWAKPPKVRSTEEHNETFVADNAPPGVYVPNMPQEWQKSWKAKKIGGNDPRVEIRKSCMGEKFYAQVLMIVRPDGKVQMSMNGKAIIDSEELIRAITEAQEALTP